MEVSPVSTMSALQIPISDEKHVVISPVEKAAYFSDEKICMPVAEGMEVHQTGSDASPQLAPSEHSDAKLPEQAYQAPFWKRHLLWLIAGVVLLIILIGILTGLVVATQYSKNETQTIKAVVTNATMNSVASSGLFLKDGTTWNMHVFSQNKTGGITLQVSLDGQQFQTAREVALTIPPKIGSPMSATAEQDEETGVVMVSVV